MSHLPSTLSYTSEGFAYFPSLLGASTSHSRHTFTTRLLLTVIPAQHYAANGATMQAVLRAVVDDFNELSQNGVEACETKSVR